METHLSIEAVAIPAFIILLVMLGLAWLDRKDSRRLMELAHLHAIETRRDRMDARRYQIESQKRWADHELLMRMILERVDGKRRS